MDGETLTMTIYGREQICASCVGAPGSKDTYEWLQAAINRKYNSEQITYQYIDMDEHTHAKKDQLMIEQMEQEDMFYPLVMLNDDIVAEGIPHLKKIFKALEERGVSEYR